MFSLKTFPTENTVKIINLLSSLLRKSKRVAMASGEPFEVTLNEL